LVTPTAPASGQAPEATELLTTEDGAVLAEAMTIETPPKALIPNAKSAPVATTAETNDETEALAETPASQIASDATIPTAADGAATNGSGSAADRDISPAISAVQDERTLVTAGVAATGQEKEPELAALPVEAADPTTNEQGHDQPADEFDQPLTEGPTSESTAPPGDRVAEAKAPSATAEPPAAAPLQQTSPAAVTSAAVGASPAPPARVLPPVIARGEGEGIPAKPIEIDSTRLLHRVARAFHVAQQRGGDIKLRLNPPELGSLRLELRIDEGVMTARMETETSTARAAIMDSLPALRERLIEQGIRIERFDVDLMQQQGQGPGEKDQGTDWKRGRVGEWESGRTAQPHIESPHSLSPSPSSDLLNGLNVIV
jgi:flagellar hook-length control protein FliK